MDTHYYLAGAELARDHFESLDKKLKLKGDKNMNDNMQLVDVDTNGSNALMSIVGANAIGKATVLAGQLANIIEAQELYTVIGSKRHVHVEAWSTLGAMLGVFPEIVRVQRVEPIQKIKGYLIERAKWNKFTRKNEIVGKFIKESLYNPKEMKVIKDGQGNELREIEEIKYIAEAVLVNINNNKQMSRGYAYCSNTEEGKLEQTENDIASMAQTRVTGKVFRLSFSWIVTLSGFNPLSAEETTIAQPEQQQIEPGNKKEDEGLPELPPLPEQKNTGLSMAEIPPAKKKIEIPKTKEEQAKLWGESVKEANKIGVNVRSFLNENGLKGRNPTVSDLPKLLPELLKQINSRMEEMERE